LTSKARLALAVLAVALACCFATACGDDEKDSASSPPNTTTPIIPATASPEPTAFPNEPALDAATLYLAETGIDGTRGEFTDPLNCPDVTDDDESEFCLHRAASIFSPGEVIIIIGDRDDPNATAWEMRVRPSGSEWQITSVKPYGYTE
jgi:hypothetical protein